MKILAFTDVHADKKAMHSIAQLTARESPDILIDCGDISIFENQLDSLVAKIAGLGKMVLILHGNHESEEAMMDACRPYENVIFMHNRILEIEDTIIFGWGGDGFSRRDGEFTKAAEQAAMIFRNNTSKNKKFILLTHGPPADTALDHIMDSHVGNRSFKEFIIKQQPDYAFCGHLHECNGIEDRVEKTIIINPGPKGKIVRL